MTKKWLREQRNEYYHRLAKIEGYRSRAAYKLLQIADKYPFIKEGNIVVDIGASPGGWMQASRKLVGDKGYVLGIDLKPITDLGYSNVFSIIGNVEKLNSEDLLAKLSRKADVVLSDLSPNVSGFWDLDQERQIHLSKTSLKLALDILHAGGNLLVKAFQGSSLNEFINMIKSYFKIVRVIKPKASRMKSSEIYILGLNLKRKHL